MKILNNRFQEAQNKIFAAGQQLQQMNSDLWLTADDKANRRQAIANDLNKEVEAATNDIYNNAFDTLADTHNDFHKSLKGDTKEKQERAAIMGPAYASMSTDELLRVLDAKFDDNTERGLLLDYLEAKAAGKQKEAGLPGLQAVTDPLQSKINETINKNIGRLTGYPANSFERYQAAKDGETFARNAAEALRTELLKHKGQLQQEDLIRRRDALNNIETLKRKYNAGIAPTQTTGANPDFVNTSKRGTQLGR